MKNAVRLINFHKTVKLVSLSCLFLGTLSKASNQEKAKIQCLISLRQYHALLSERAPSNSDAELPHTPLESPKKIDQAVDLLKHKARTIHVVEKGNLSLRDHYYEKTTALVNGKEIITYRPKKDGDALRQDVLEVLDDFRKILNADTELNTTHSVGAYEDILKAFLDEAEDQSPKWFEKKVVRYNSMLLRPETTLLDFIDALIVDHATETGLLTLPKPEANGRIQWILNKVGMSGTTRKWWAKRIKARYANALIDGTIALPARIPEILITGFVASALTAWWMHKDNQRQSVQENERNEIIAAQDAARIIEEKKAELRKIINSLQSTAKTFQVATKSDKDSIDIWKMFNDKFVNFSEEFSKYSAGIGLFEKDPTARIVIEAFIKELDATLKSIPAQTTSGNHALAKSVVAKLYVKSFLLGEKTTKNDLKHLLQTLEVYDEFNVAFAEEVLFIIEYLNVALTNLKVQIKKSSK